MKELAHEVKAPLPDFEHPPVVEVALSVQLEPLAKLSTQDLAVFWDEVLHRERSWKEAPPIPPALEWFGIPQPQANVELRFQQLEEPPPHRALFVSTDQTSLLQLQRDRLVQNWRKANNQPYPRYQQIRTGFREQFEALCRFVADRRLGACVPNQCEVTYVNHIEWGREGQPPEDLSEVLASWTAKNTDAFLGAPENVDLVTHHIIRTEGVPVGRLHIAANPRYRGDDLQPLLMLTLTARGRPTSEGVDDVMRFLDLGHEHVVRGFASVTTPEMHKRWGRRA
jgi:uncharacterized protein (TIGR04255 family)